MKLLTPKIRNIFEEFTAVEKAFFLVLSFFLIFSSIMTAYSVIDSFRHDAAAKGGAIHEGGVGTPSFINPVLSFSNSGRDLTSLTYSGLMRINGKGELVPELAESYTLSEDGKTYTFILREGLTFHDGEKLTSDDVMFTIDTVKNPAIKSPLASNWQGVTVKAIDERTIEFHLKTPYAPFIENTTIGILPHHIWTGDIDQFTYSIHNFEPIGSGPYKVADIKRNLDGTPQLFTLETFREYVPGEKNISTIHYHIYPDTQVLVDALTKGEIQGAGDISPSTAAQLKEKGFNIKTADLLRIFGVFFNQNQAAVFVDKDVRIALNMAVDKNLIVDKVMHSYANAEDAPLPGSIPAVQSEDPASSAINYLESKGWKKNAGGIMEKKSSKGTTTISFILTTSTNPELKETAELLKEQWAAIGVEVKIEALDPTTLNQDIIRPRKYDALLFGEVTGRGNDLYPFWYSGERKDPGLNIALYTNSKADTLLERARTATSSEQTSKNLADFVSIVKEEQPAIFLYSPKFIYVAPKQLKGLELPPIDLAHERWAGILDAYINTRRVW